MALMCEDLLSRCTYALVVAFGAAVAALVALAKAHDAQKKINENP